jgi:hypothetical protein
MEKMMKMAHGPFKNGDRIFIYFVRKQLITSNISQLLPFISANFISIIICWCLFVPCPWVSCLENGCHPPTTNEMM